MKQSLILSLLIVCGNLTAATKFLLLLGPSGTGKSTIIRHLKTMDSRFEYITPLTTRALRDGETDKVHVTLDEIEQLKQENKLLTINTIYGIHYATPKHLIDSALANQRFPVLDWPIDKLEIMQATYGDRLLTIYLQPDDLNELKKRLSNDGRDKDGKRYTAGIQEIGNLIAGKYDHLIDLKMVNAKNHDYEIAQAIYKQYLSSIN